METLSILFSYMAISVETFTHQDVLFNQIIKVGRRRFSLAQRTVPPQFNPWMWASTTQLTVLASGKWVFDPVSVTAPATPSGWWWLFHSGRGLGLKSTNINIIFQKKHLKSSVVQRRRPPCHWQWFNRENSLMLFELTGLFELNWAAWAVTAIMVEEANNRASSDITWGLHRGPSGDRGFIQPFSHMEKYFQTSGNTLWCVKLALFPFNHWLSIVMQIHVTMIILKRMPHE